jgi:hypothetical protein
MAIVVKWAEDGDYLKSAERGDPIGPVINWTGKQKRAMRFDSQAAFSTWASSVGILHKSKRPEWWSDLRYFRLVPRKRHASPQP